MKKKIPYLVILLVMFMDCSDAPDIYYGPCKFAPAESKFPELAYAYCDECFFKIHFNGEDYSFTGKQIETRSSGAGGYPPEENLIRMTSNSFFAFHFISPHTDELLVNGLGIKTRLLKRDTLSKLHDYAPPPVSVSFGIYNYCKDFFEPVNTSIDQSHNQLTKVELIESHPVEVNHEPYQLFYFYCEGEISATFIINEETETVKANYKVWTEIYEKL